ncbi:MAG: insulinase family protein [Deltaproteobacteria bacterium]|nr:insulinase family protein [Deltaproteobacteria bacterium]
MWRARSSSLAQAGLRTAACAVAVGALFGCRAPLPPPTAPLVAVPVAELPGPPPAPPLEVRVPEVQTATRADGLTVYAVRSEGDAQVSLRWLVPAAGEDLDEDPLLGRVAGAALAAEVRARAGLLPGQVWSRQAPQALELGVDVPAAQGPRAVAALVAALEAGPSPAAVAAGRAEVLRTLRGEDGAEVLPGALRHLQALRYGPSHRLGEAPEDKAARLSDVTPAAVRAHVAARIRAAGATLVVAARDPAPLLAGLPTRLALAPPPALARPLGPAPPPARMPVRVSLDSYYPLVALMFDAPPAAGRDAEVFEVVNLALGDGLESLLFRAVRTESGASYAVGSEYRPRVRDGALLIVANTSTEAVREVVTAVRATVTRVAQEGLQEEEIRRGVARLLVAAAAARATASGAAAWVVEERLRGRSPGGAAARLARLRSLDAAEVRAVLARTVDPARVVAVIAFSRFSLVDGVGLGDVKEAPLRHL